MSKSLFTVAALLLSATAGADAQVVGALGGGSGPYLSLNPAAACTALTPCTLGGTVGTIVGGTIYESDLPFADIPAGGVFENRFLAAGPTSSAPSTLTFTAPLPYISFLWGSPDLYNVLTVNTTAGSVEFTAASLGFASTDGNQTFSQYVQFTAAPGAQITSLVFNNSPQINAFEVANFTTNVVPEPSTYALMSAGLLALGFAAKRRKQV